MDTPSSSQSVKDSFDRITAKLLMDIDHDEVDPEAFLLDALDALCQEKTPESGKLQLLTIFQEKAPTLVELLHNTSLQWPRLENFESMQWTLEFPNQNPNRKLLAQIIKWSTLNITSAEHVTGSLKNMYLYPIGNDSQFYKCQLLVTLTVVLVLSSTKLKNLQENCETLHSSIQFLMDVISEVNHSASALIRKTACECLWEVELSYPGILQDRLGSFFRFCDKERSVIFQSYMILFVTTLKNAINHISTFHERFPDHFPMNYLSELLSSETDLSMKMNYLFQLGVLEEQFPVILSGGSGRSFEVSLPRKFEDKELKRAVSYIAENCNLLTNIPVFHVLLQLMHCVKLASLSPTVFKSQFVNSLSATTDLPLFQLILLLKATFSTKLIQEADSFILLQRLSNLSNQPHLLAGQRLLCYQWLIDFPRQDQLEQKVGMASLAELMDFTLKADFHPTVFDPLEIIPGKLNVLSTCYIPRNGPDIATATLMNCLTCLHNPVNHGLGRPYVTMLFQVLFCYYSRHRDTALVHEIYRFLLAFATEHPDLVPFILDFTLSVSILTPESFLPSKLLGKFTGYIVELPLKVQLRNIRNFLKAFEYAMKLKDISPMGAIDYLQELLKVDEIYRTGGLSVGNSILHVCKSILQFHDTSKIIKAFGHQAVIFVRKKTAEIIRELGDCLLAINKTYCDVDVRDRAKLYYSLLTSISTEKSSRLLAGSLTAGQGIQRHSTKGITTSPFATALPMQETKYPFLTLTRISRGNDHLNEDTERDCPRTNGSPLNEEETFSTYLSQMNDTSDETSITIPFYLHYNTEPSEEVPDIIFAAVIQLQTASNYKTISDIHIPYLSYKYSREPVEGCHIVEVKFSPKEPVPACINARVIYSSTTGCSYIIPLKPIVIQFSDLFIPLGQPTRSLSNVTHILSPQQLFNALWKHIEQHQYSRKNRNFTGAKSIVVLDVERSRVDVTLTQLASHIISQTDAETLVGVVLPPKHHFLLRFVLQPVRTVVHVATDRWQILGLVDEFLKI